MIANYLDPSAPANENKWAMEDFGGETDVPYATTFGLFNTGGPTRSATTATRPPTPSSTPRSPAATRRR